MRDRPCWETHLCNFCNEVEDRDDRTSFKTSGTARRRSSSLSRLHACLKPSVYSGGYREAKWKSPLRWPQTFRVSSA
jgi:hypothetical protein